LKTAKYLHWLTSSLRFLSGRRVLAHAFSNSAVVAQEPLVQRYVDQFIDKLKEAANNSQGSVDMVQWYTW
jgi:cytochrome P450